MLKTALSAETLREIFALAEDMSNLFAQPEYIPGCEVMSIADIDDIATNNGWIEAVCGKHNQQRCRWFNNYNGVQVGDYVNVLYFKSFGLFTVLNEGGDGAMESRGNVWPKASQANISETVYTDIDDFGDALANGDQGIIGEWQTTTDVTGGHATVPTGADVKGSGVDVTILTSADSNGTLLVAGATLLEQMTITNTNSSNGLCVGSSTANITLRADMVKVVCESASGYNQGFYIQGTGELINCRAECAGGGTNDYAVWAYDNGSGADVTIRKGYYDGDIVAENSNAVITLDGPVITGSVTEVSNGTIQGHYYDANDNLILLGFGIDVIPGGDEIGLLKRVTAGYSLEDNFETDTLDTAWGWETGYGSFITPGQVDITILPSNLILAQTTSASGPKSFLRRTDNLTDGFFGFGFCLNNPPDLMYAGCRFDDGSNNNYVEGVMRKESGGGRLEIVTNIMTGGVGPTTTVQAYIYDWPKLMYIRLQNVGTQWSNWAALVGFGIDTQAIRNFTVGTSLTWTPVNRGFCFYRNSTSPIATFRGPYIDFAFRSGA